MDSSIKAEKKLQAMKTNKKKKGHHGFVHNFVVYAITAFLSSLFYLYLFCFPSMRHFLFDFLPNVYSFLLSSKFLFLLGNIIVIVLFVGESRNKVNASSGFRSSLADEIYDEYMEIRSRTLKRQQTFDDCKKKNQQVEDEDKDGKIINCKMIRRNCSSNNISDSLEVRKKKKEMTMAMTIAMVAHRGQDQGLARRPRSFIVEHKEKEKKEEDGNPIMIHENDSKIRSLELDQEKIRKEISISVNHGTMTRPKSLGRLDHIHEISSGNNGIGGGDGDSGIVTKMTCREDKRKEIEKSMDELNKRVEEFITRVNKQRMLEAKELESSLD